MTTSLCIWTGFHAAALFAVLVSQKPDASSSAALVMGTWLAFGAMLWTGHSGWFLWTNIPIILLMALSGFYHLGKPPNPHNEEQAANVLWATVFRLALVLVCWFTA